MEKSNQTQWWKEYIPQISKSETDTNNDKKIEKLEDIWKVTPGQEGDYQRTFYELERVINDNCSTNVLNEVLERINNSSYGGHQAERRKYDLIETLCEIPSITDCSFNLLKETRVKHGMSSDSIKAYQTRKLDDIVLSHKDCTEKDLIDISRNVYIGWTPEIYGNDYYDSDEFKIGELSKWAKIFMNPRASKELKEDIAMSCNIKQEFLDYYIQRDDCPQELLSRAIRETMTEDFNRYYRNSDYKIDAKKLNKIVAHPNMTDKAFDLALYIVREDMVEPAEIPEDDEIYFKGRDDTCSLSQKDKLQIMQTMLTNKNCTQDVAVGIFSAAKKSELLAEIKMFTQKEKIFLEAEQEMEKKEAEIAKKKAEIARKKEIEQAISRVHKKLDYLTLKKEGDIEFNKAIMHEKLTSNDLLTHKVEGNTSHNKKIIKLHNLVKKNQNINR